MGRKFSLKTVCVIGIQVINRIKYIHSRHYIHRDIKPDNFMTGISQNENTIYIIDFGLAKKYYSISTKQHIKQSSGKSIVGTARYCSRNAHKGGEQSRKDDLESIGYMLMYFLLGKLPWKGLLSKNGEDQFTRIARKKLETSFEELCNNQPKEFLLYFKYIDNLCFEQEPNYGYLQKWFKDMITQYCCLCNYDFDWKKEATSRRASKSTINGKTKSKGSWRVNNAISNINDISNLNKTVYDDDKSNNVKKQDHITENRKDRNLAKETEGNIQKVATHGTSINNASTNNEDIKTKIDAKPHNKGKPAKQRLSVDYGNTETTSNKNNADKNAKPRKVNKKQKRHNSCDKVNQWNDSTECGCNVF